MTHVGAGGIASDLEMLLQGTCLVLMEDDILLGQEDHPEKGCSPKGSAGQGASLWGLIARLLRWGLSLPATIFLHYFCYVTHHTVSFLSEWR